MAVKIGQLRKNNISGANPFLTPITTTNLRIGQYAFNTSTDNDSIAFLDTYLENTEGFLAGEYYYIRLNIQRIDVSKSMGSSGGSADIDPHYQNLDIRLFDSANKMRQTLENNLIIFPYTDGGDYSINDLEANFMTWCNSAIVNAPQDAQTYFSILNTEYQRKIENITDVNTSDYRNKYQVVEFIFSPYVAVDKIAFILRRTTYDYNFTARLIEFEGQNDGTLWDNLDICKINNILPNNIIADKIGVQSDPGTLVLVNSEPMRVGKSGILEINCGIPITNLGFAAPMREIKDFIVDYTYTEST